MLLTFIGALLASVVFTGLLRRYALSKSLIDIPNERSSHTIPVPRGGGLSIVLISLLSIAVLTVWQLLDSQQGIALLGGGSLVALIGWLDDHQDLSAKFRAFVHLIAAIWTVYWLEGFAALNLGFNFLNLGVFGSVLACIAMVWLINLYNFMDGTDGIASVQALTAGCGACLIFYLSGAEGLTLVVLAMLGATVGFLFWNWSPAKIFMGDVGSSFLGYLFGALALIGENSGVMPVFVWFILLALFVWDASLTLIYRFSKGEKWYAAHNSHAYQRYVQMGNSHKKLAICFLLINITVLWPAVWLAMNYHNALLIFVLITAMLAFVLWLVIRKKYTHYQQ